MLGCTHYPILRDLIGEVVGADVPLIDSGEAAAGEVQSLLESNATAGARARKAKSRSVNFVTTSIIST